MSVIINKTVGAVVSGPVKIQQPTTISATSGIGSGEDCTIEVWAGPFGWANSGEILSSAVPAVNVLPPVTIRISKPSSAAEFGIVKIQDCPGDLDVT